MNRALVPLLCAALAACATGGHPATRTAAPADLAIVHASVVDVESGEILRDRTVLVRSGRIAAVAPSSELGAPAGVRVVDGTGRFLIPGLWDMHVHGARDGRALHFWPLFLAHGVTGVREMGSYLDSLRHWRAVAARPGSGAPRIVWSSPMLDGVPTAWVHGYGVPDPGAAPSAVTTMRAAGFDFLKVYERLPRETYLAIAAEARRTGIPFAGHVPDGLTLAEASDAGQRSVEHVTMSFPCTSRAPELMGELWRALDASGPEGEATRAALGRLAAAAEMGPDPGTCAPLLARLAENGTWLTPTLTVVRGWHAPGGLADDARLRFVPPALAARWREGLAGTPGTQRAYARLIERQGGPFLVAAERSGVGILVGTDASDEPYVFAGSGVHDEMELLVEAGLSPLEALRAATLNPARFLGATDSMGTVAAARVADLVLLDANPLEEIGNVRRIHAVVAGGRLIDAGERERLLRRAEEEARRSAVAPPARQ